MEKGEEGIRQEREKQRIRRREKKGKGKFEIDWAIF